MSRAHFLPGRGGRILIASLALVANLIAAGVPVLHAWTHAAGHGHEEVANAPVKLEHSHDEVHPAGLHDDFVVAHRVTVDLLMAVPALPIGVESFSVRAAPSFRPVAPAPSRAPPTLVQARAPPLA